MSRIKLTVLAMLALMPSSPVAAVDGVIEINQAKALAGGVNGSLINDPAGFPVTITQIGSYRLTGNLIVPDENTDGIFVTTPNVSIDLNGFAIVRSGCETAVISPFDCTAGSGTGSGVKLAFPNFPGVSVKNGSVIGMGSTGVLLGIQAEVSAVRVRWNRTDGINAGASSIVSGNTAFDNGGDGIRADTASIVSGNTAMNNGADGIDALNGASVSDNTVLNNLGFGLNLGLGAGYRGNVISGNGAGTVSGGVNQGSNSCDASTTCP